jgi:hypothetical protein
VRLKCEVCGKIEEVMSREDFEARTEPLTEKDRWMALRYSKEDPDHEPKVRSIVCSNEGCLELAMSVSGASPGLRFRDADRREWFAMPPIEVFFAIEDQLPKGCVVQKTKLVEILATEEVG